MNNVGEQDMAHISSTNPEHVHTSQYSASCYSRYDVYVMISALDGVVTDGACVLLCAQSLAPPQCVWVQTHLSQSLQFFLVLCVVID